ncbi:MAG: hypothetical protein WC447_01780 [Candidatus Paceibacterota bacterium]|jgi:CDP-diglyceride synthetase
METSLFRFFAVFIVILVVCLISIIGELNQNYTSGMIAVSGVLTIIVLIIKGFLKNSFDNSYEQLLILIAGIIGIIGWVSILTGIMSLQWPATGIIMIGIKMLCVVLSVIVALDVVVVFIFCLVLCLCVGSERYC